MLKSLSSLKKKILSKVSITSKPLNSNFENTRFAALPYISGDAFLSIADAAILHGYNEPLFLRDKRQIIFVEADLIEISDVLKFASTFDVVIVHNGDHEISRHVIEFLISSNTFLYATNIANDTYQSAYTIPIGIENAHYDNNGSVHHYNQLSMSRLSLKKNSDLLASFSISTNLSVRGPLANELANAGYSNEKMNLTEYRLKLANSRFVISPPGNGTDCHRTWEAFYHKTIPVVEKRYWHFSQHNLPVFVVDEYRNFLSLSTHDMQRIYAEIINNDYYDAIYFEYWHDLIRKALNL